MVVKLKFNFFFNGIVVKFFLKRNVLLNCYISLNCVNKRYFKRISKRSKVNFLFILLLNSFVESGLLKHK